MTPKTNLKYLRRVVKAFSEAAVAVGRLADELQKIKDHELVKMTREEWYGLKKGQIIYGRSGRVRILLEDCHHGSITLNKVRGNGTTVYCSGDRYNFYLEKPVKNFRKKNVSSNK